MSAQQLKQLLQAKKYQECADLAIQVLQKEKQNKAVILFLAQAQVKLGDLQNSQNNLNLVYGMVQKGTTDDALLFNALLTQEELAIKLQESPQPASHKTGRNIQLTNKYQIIDFLDKKQRYDQMLEESEAYCLLLLEDERYKEIEDTYLWLMNHKGLSDDMRANYGARIFEIDQFYNPFTRLDFLFPQLIKLAPQSPALQKLALKMLEVLEKQGGKKTLASVFSAQNVNEQQIQQFKEFCEQIKTTGSLCFTTTDTIFKNKSQIKMFTMYLSAIAGTTVFLSEDWSKFEQRVAQLLNTTYCKNTIGDLEQNPIQIYLYSFLDVSKFTKEGRLPNYTELWISKLPVNQCSEMLDTFSKDFQDYSFIVNAYYAMCSTAQDSPFKLDAQATFAKINQAQYLLRKAQYNKLTPQRDVSDLQVYLSCLLLKLNLGAEAFEVNFTQSENSYIKHQGNCSKAVLDFYQTLTVDLKWQQNLNSGKWLQAIEGLNELTLLHPAKVDFALVKKCEIQLSHLTEICGDKESDKNLFIQGLMGTLQSQSNVESENLLLQGFLFWTYPQLFQADQKAALNKWLLALKKDQTKPEIYFSLAVYYFTINDMKRASGCLDKVLKLHPDFEQAFVLQYYLLQTTELRLVLLDNFIQKNRNVAVTYFFRGLIMQQNQDFIQAIEMYQNAIKFYTIQKSKQLKPLLLPKVELTLHKNPFGIYGEANAAICWVYQCECFMKINKPQVALKCFTQGIEEISKVKTATEEPLSADVEILLQILKFAKFQPSQMEIQNDQILTTLQKTQPSKWALECLMLGAKLVTSHVASIAILNVALQCQPTQNILGFILTEIISRVTALVETSVIFVNGKVQLLADTTSLIERLDSLLDFVSNRPEYLQCFNLQKKRLNAIFVIAQRTLSKDRYKQALDTAKLLFENQQYHSLTLDYAKIIHEYQRLDDSDSSLQNTKILLIRKAIQLEPTSANLWVYLHMFAKDDLVCQNAIFKAYELEPESTFVQETILRYYLKTKQWRKAFKIIVRSYQRAAKASEPQHPIILATLAYFNAFCYFEQGQRQQLLEALSLIRLVDREDMRQLLSEIYIYLSHYNGDYLKTLNFFESKPKSQETELLLIKAHLGTNIHQYDSIQNRIKALNLTSQELDQVFGAESLSNDDLKQKCQQQVAKFVMNPIDVAPILALYQELCLKRGLVLNVNLLDEPDVKIALQKVEIQYQRMLLIQGLRLLQQRDGMIKEAKAFVEGANVGQKTSASSIQLQQSQNSDSKSYTVFVIEASRLKPQSISTSQHKALLRLYLAAKLDATALQGYFAEGPVNLINQAKLQGIKNILKQKRESANNGLSHLMREPLNIDANTKWLWSLLRAGKIQQAIGGYKMVKSRIDLGILQGEKSQFGVFENFINSLVSEEVQELPSRLSLISKICKSLQGVQKVTDEANMREIAVRLIKILQKVQDQNQQQLVQVIFSTLQFTLIEQGHYNIYNKLVKEVLNCATVATVNQTVLNLMWHYQLLNTASSLLQLKKITQVIPLCKEVENLSRQGEVQRGLLPVSLLKARAYLALNNQSQLQQSLNIDDVALERDFLLALSLYSSQEYKQCYLVCLGLVAGAKSSEASKWHLAYAYYLKAFSEMTFLMAKRMGIRLKEDFTAADGNYGEVYFQTKSKTSLTKCLENLEIVGESNGILSRAVVEMLKQI